MRAHVLQHVPFEDEGSMAHWLQFRGAQVTRTCFFEHGWRLPRLEDIDLLIVMGGPMSANDEEHHPWLRREKLLVRESVVAGVPMIGVCLGAQLLASAMGAQVYPAASKEIGWRDIHGADVPDGYFRFPSALRVLHWHGETFDLPSGATRLAGNDLARNQAFRCGRRAIGLQFHLETTTESIQRLIENCRDELTPGPHISSESEMLAEPATRYAQINALMDRVLEFLVGGHGN